jgi:hypothetical protein
MPSIQIQDVAELIRLEYAETPGLKLTFRQVQGLWNLSEELCDRVLNTLIETRFLVRTADGRFARAHSERSTVDSIASLLRSMGSNH